MTAIVEIIFRMIVTIVFCILLLPFIMILATPIILLGVPFTRQRYVEGVKNGYRNAFDLWKNISEAMPCL